PDTGGCRAGGRDLGTSAGRRGESPEARHDVRLIPPGEAKVLARVGGCRTHEFSSHRADGPPIAPGLAVPRIPRSVAVPRVSVAATLSRARRRDRRPSRRRGEGDPGVDVRSRPAPLLRRFGRGALAGEPRSG